MHRYSDYGDDFYVTMNLSTHLELPRNRETLLHYFERIRRRYPMLQHFYGRDKDELVLEEDKTGEGYRWVSVESQRVNSGAVNPESIDEALRQHRDVLEQVPFDLSVTPLDCETLSIVYGFDFSCRGNHNEMLAKAIGLPPGLESFGSMPYGKILANEPALQFALDEQCRTQCRVSFENRTNAYQVRTGEFGEDVMSVYLTVRRYDSLEPDQSYVDEFNRLAALCGDIADEYLIPGVLQPLQEAIAID